MAYRGISDSVGHSESLAALSDTAERLYWRLLAHSDPHGRLPGSPAKTRAVCFPLLDWTYEQVGEALSELEHVNRIQVYDVDGTVVIQITDFDRNQPPEFIRRRGKARFPEPPTLKSGTTPDYSRSLYELPAKQHDSRTTPDLVRSSPATRQLRQGNALTQQQHVARNEPATAALNELLDTLGITDSGVRFASHQDTSRAILCAEKALAEANTSPIGYYRRLLESGDTPQSAPIVAVSTCEKIMRMISNGAIVDRVDLEAELRAHAALTEAETDQIFKMLASAA